MSIYGYKPKTKPAPWLATPKGRAVAARNRAGRVARAETLERARRERRVAAGGVRPRSKSMTALMKLYNAERRKFLAENWTCWACVHTGVNRVKRSEDLHHARGRLNGLLLDKRYWVALCREHHDRVEADKPWARALGLLPSLGGWNRALKEP